MPDITRNVSIEKKDITNYLKNYGFLLPNAEIYGGLAKAWDLGTYGAELKRNLKNLWWKYFITSSPYNVGCDSLIITHSRVLKSSGHLKNFHDWLIECLSCQKRYRLDNLLTNDEFTSFLEQTDKSNYSVKVNCSNCQHNNFTTPRQFNLLLTTNLEITTKQTNIVYLRPETCQGIFINFLAIQRSTRKKLPFGIGQIGKSFRNEITLHHGIFRTREFEQMELEFFCSKKESQKWWDYWTEKSWNFLQKAVVDNQARVKKVNLEPDELPHYAKKTLDLYFNYHFGWGELCSISDRGDYDLSQHSKYSEKDLIINKIVPEVIEVSFGVERLMLAILESAYQEEIVEKSQLTRTILKIHPLLAPYFVAIIPQSQQLIPQTYHLYENLLKEVQFNLTYEETGSIGNRYRRQDAIGTYYCLTFDFQSCEDQKITIRQRDTMEQIRIEINSLKNYLTDQYEKFFQEFTK